MNLSSDNRYFTLRKSDILHWAMLFLFSFVLLLLLSPDSWLAHICGPRFDPAWFFTAGRAWAEGLTPYVDFADSKGPVLWLIYAIGYIISPTTYLGIFCQSVVYFTVSFHFIWLTARLFANRRESLLVLFLMPAMLFFRAYLIETRAEDFTLPWVFMGLYITCRSLMQPSLAFIRKGAFWLGFGMMFCMLIKWNVFFMMGGMALVVTGVSFQRKSSAALIFGMLGMIVSALPFIVYFMCKGNFGAFINEYFVSTYLITDTDTTAEMFEKFFTNLFANRLETLKTIVLITPFAGTWLFCRRFHISYWLIFAYVPFYIFLAFKAPFFHYCCTAVPFYLFLLIFLARGCSRIMHKATALTFGAALALIYIATIAFCSINANLKFKHNGYWPEWNAIQQVMTQKNKPTFMFSGNDMGQGLLSRAIPGCRYWALQSGATPEMVKERMDAIKSGKLDFIVITQIPSDDFIPFIEKCGYRQCYGKVTESGKTTIKPLPLYEKAQHAR